MLFVILVAHFVADFVLQTRWQAMNKSSSWTALNDHVAVYMVTMLAIVSIGMGLLDGQIPYPPPLIAWAGINGLLHFVTDAGTSRLNKYLYQRFRDDPAHHWFFVGVGFDQLVHYATLFSTYACFTSGLLLL